MKVLRYGHDEIVPVADASVTLGSFDGVHLGHHALLDRVLAGNCPTVVTFDPHPQHVLKNRADKLQILTPIREKIRKLELLGIERMVILPFNQKMAELSAEEFLRDLLVNTIGMKRLVVGFNHSFGKNREGTIDFLREKEGELGFELDVVDAHIEASSAVSSTRIRKALAQGDLALATQLLGHPYRLDATVIHGDERGRDLGYPTANLRLDDEQQLIPAGGVYAAKVYLEDGTVCNGAGSIGTNPTFGKDKLSIEVHLLDETLDLYGERIQVEWIGYIRPQVAFDSRDTLIAQMHNDIQDIRTVLKRYKEKKHS